MRPRSPGIPILRPRSPATQPRSECRRLRWVIAVVGVLIYGTSSLFFGFSWPLLVLRQQQISNPFRRKKVYARICPETGPSSAAPVNADFVSSSLKSAVKRITEKPGIGNRVLYSTVNEEASVQNLPLFLYSLKNVQPPLIRSTIVVCLDAAACSNCRSLHIDPELCIYANLQVSGESLAPSTGGKDMNTRYYWRLMFGRVYITLVLHSEGVTVVPVDVDSFFLQNPFSSGQELSSHPHGIAGVVDTKMLNLLDKTEKLLMNGGFLYYPATTTKSAILTNNAIRDIWKQSCMAQNEQLVTTTVIRELAGLVDDPALRPRILSPEQFVSFCSLHCGYSGFYSIKSVEQLQKMDSSFEGQEVFRACAPAARQKWTFFHAACATWPSEGKTHYSRSKRQSLEAIYAWVKGYNNTQFLPQPLLATPKPKIVNKN